MQGQLWAGHLTKMIEMKKVKIKFKVKQKIGISEKIATIEVPENWDDIAEDEKREFLIKPVSSSHHSYGPIIHSSSRFQMATGIYDEVIDFDFEVIE